MSSTTSDPVTVDRVAAALETMGLFPFVSDKGQVAAILPNRTLRIILPDSGPAQGVAEYPRHFHASYAPQLAETVRVFNATTYLPKATTLVTDEGMIAVRFFHCFNWIVGATDAQLGGEITQFVLSCIALQQRLDQQYPDQWTKEPSDA